MPEQQPITKYSKLYDRFSKENDYQKVPLIENEWDAVKDQSEVKNYLPKPNTTTITTGISKIQTETISNFESIDISKSIPNKRAHILNVGCSVWGLDFVPKPSSNKSSDQYLAIGGYNSTKEHHLLTEDVNKGDEYNAIQIWKCRSYVTKFRPMLDMCILHDFGVVVDFKWCPYSIYDDKKLGILAAMFNNGDIRIFVVPHPESVRKKNKLVQEDTVYIKVKQARLVLKLSNKSDNAFCFAWGGYRNLACGTRSGSIVVWNILESLLQDTALIHVNIPNASLLAIRCIAWKSLFDDTILFSSDMDGNIHLHDLNDPFFPSKIFRVRHTYICLCGPGFASGFLYGESDGIMRKNIYLTTRKSITLTSHNSMIWQCAVSPHHGIMASVSSNGKAMVKPFAHDDIEYTQSHRPAECTLYELEYDQESKIFKYIDGIRPKTTFPEREYYNVLLNPIIALQKIAWNTNKNACGWVVSGGAAGLCRLEYTGL
ncbi:WD40-repeat-containing domain protein [Parasitella parasitica]|nr:WD40-repeat-containing domain protein [Parasitella parasitica]